MFNNYAKTAIRGMRRHWTYTLINVTGLAVGFIAGFFILLWVSDEISFNSGYDDGEQVYRVMRTSTYGPGQVYTWPYITAKLDEVLDENYPEIELAALISGGQNMALRSGDVVFREAGIHGGPDFFRIMSHDFLAGDSESALNSPESIVLSETLARKYFPDAFEGQTPEVGASAVLGSVLSLENRQDVQVSGVYRDVSAQNTYRPDFVLPMAEFVARNAWVNEWGNNGLRMMVRLIPGADASVVSDKIRMLVQENTDSDTDVLFLQPLSDVHLRSKFENGQLVGGRIDYLRIFSIVGIFILLIAAINFTNLSTARASQRTLEVGVRKTFGSGRARLATQFLAESVFTSLAALLLAAVAVVLLLTPFNTLTGKSITIGSGDWLIWAQFLALAVVTGLAAGWYPAAYLSGFSVVGVLRKNDNRAGRGINLRRGLVVFQFVMSVILIVGAGTVSNQLDYIRSKNLGLDRQDVFYSTLDGDLKDQFGTYKARMMQSPAIQSVTAGSNTPLSVGSSTSGGVQWEGRPEDDNTLYNLLQVNHDFTATMRMKLVAGRDFSQDFVADSANIVINETAVRAMGFDEPLGKTVTVWGRTGEIIGVVEDFHFASLYEPIDPMVMRLAPELTGYTFVRPTPGQTTAALAHFATVFKEFNPQAPLETPFLDTQFEEMYRSEVVIKKLTGWFTLLAILVACLGLFGLASFTAARRTKEIGVRKVLGASVAGIVGLLSREFVALVGLAIAIAMPVSWYIMDGWLADFEFHAPMSWRLYLAAGVGVVLLTYATVGFQSVKAAVANPVEALRNE
jgi:putative ABC transport system permease protein